jgi:ABC-type amino acid transport substrate-binding protein
MPLPGVEPITYHMFIAKTSPRAYELVAKINQALLILQHNGVSKRIFEKYLPMQRKAKK